MKHRVTALLSLLFTIAISAFGFQAPQPFSADFTSTTSDGKPMAKGKLYASGYKFRVDMNEMNNQRGPMGGTGNVIVDSKTNTSYLLMPQMQMYMEYHSNENSPAFRQIPRIEATGDPCAGRQGYNCKRVGSENLNRRSCTKWEVTDNNGKKGTAWMDDKLHLPIKMQDADRTWVVSNIKEGAQPESLFEVPAGYRKFDAAAMGGQRPKK
ncbi:MAG TPA: DUF4412 domain-containing protein [Candidatus Limnocylindrales bacterium]|nr:DUF4412 domain-containing protein [Candidatus Limnocylindrales bacterium]